MSHFRKKPVVIEAQQLTHNNGLVLAGWVGGDAYWRARPNSVVIPTLEGDMTASEDDWIIKGVQGEFYPCKPDIFEATYEPVDA